MPGRDVVLHRIVQRAYDAALQPALWPEVLGSFCNLVGATSALFAFAKLSDPRGAIGASVRFDPEGARLYGEYFGTHDPWGLEARKRGLFKAGVVLPSHAVVAYGALRRTEFHNDFGKRFGVVRGISGVILSNPDAASVLTVMRPDSKDEFDDAAVGLVQCLVPHLRRALSVHEKISEADGERAALAAALDRLACGVLLVDAGGAVVFANRAMDDILASADGLRLRQKRLRADRPDEDAQLRGLLHLSSLSALDGVRTDALRVSRPSGKRHFVIVAAPLAASEMGFESPLPHVRPSMIVFVSDPDRHPRPPIEGLRAMYHMTPGEARVAAALLTGASIGRVAEMLSISVSTARTHLAHILAKTSTRRQTELMRVLLTAVNPIAGD